MDQINPFVGLVPVQYRQDRFIGREELLSQAEGHLDAFRELAIVGPEQSGKTTLLNWIKANPDYGWKVMQITHCGNPLRALAEQLLLPSTMGPHLMPEGMEVASEKVIQMYWGELKRGPNHLAQLLSPIKNTVHPPVQLLLVVDDLEKIMRRCVDDRDQMEVWWMFFGLLQHARREIMGFHTLLSTTGAGLDLCYQLPALRGILNTNLLLMTAMSREEMRQVIRQALESSQVAFDASLIYTLVDSFTRSAHPLPLLQCTMADLWRQAFVMNPSAPKIDLACAKAADIDPYAPVIR